MESNVTPNITRLLDSFSTLPPIVNQGDCGCIELDLETHSLGLTSIQFHPLKVTQLANSEKTNQLIFQN